MEDLSRFKQTYFEESAELLEVAETGLLRLTPGAVDMDEVNAIFRAVHSIKGGGGAFGYNELVSFAHEFETVMDAVRTGSLPVTAPLVDTLIRSNDVLGAMLARVKADQPVPIDMGLEVMVALRRHLAGNPQPPAAPPPPAIHAVDEDDDGGIFPDALQTIAEARAEESAAAAPPVPEAGTVAWTIEFRPKPDLLLSGNEPAYLLRALRRLGRASVECHLDRLPGLGELEPELLALGWTVRLLAEDSVDRAAIEDVFEFVVDECDLTITAVAPPPALRAAAAGQTAADEPAPEAPAAQPAAPQPAAARPTAARPTAAQPSAPQPTEDPAKARPREGGAVGGTPAGLGGQTIRVDLDKIDRLVNMVGEMVITQAMVVEHLRKRPAGEFQELLEGLDQLSQHTRELRESVMSIRAQPVSSVFARMPRLVRELSGELGKDIHLVTSGETTEVDKTVVENLVDPLTHMIRNSIDHGLETPDERVAAGKPRTGTVHLSAQHRSGRIVIEVADDGRGIDRPRVLRKAVEKGLVPGGATLSDEEIDNLIFLPGFSTADTVSNISGRGVGMDVVRRNITSLGGRIAVQSTAGEGSRFVLSLPLTLAVLDGMVVSVGAERFVLPLTNIIESLRPKPSDLHGLVGRCDVMMARGAYVRLAYLHQLFGIPGGIGDPTRALVVLVETEDGARLGLVVDEVLGEQQVVIKSMEANFRRLDGVAAATILGDGRVALILDVAGLREMSRTGERAPSRPPALPALPSPETVESRP